MAMTTVMVLVESSPKGRWAIETAFLAARREGGHVVGLYPVPPSERLSPEKMMLSRAALAGPGTDVREMLDLAERKGGAGVDAAESTFVEVAEAFGATMQERPPNRGILTAYFKALPAGRADEVAEQGRVFDLVAVRQPRDDPDHWVRNILRAVLFKAGRPVLVAPPKAPATVGKRPLIAWNGSALSARAAAIARNFFTGAREVGILSVRTKDWWGPSAQDLADYIAWHNIKATVIEAEQANRRLGEVFLGQAEAFEADLLVMGAYSQSPFRESLTGGLTNHVLSHAEVPILMTH